MQEKTTEPVDPLHFVYVNAKAERKEVVLDRWRESGLYLQGFANDGRWKTYRIDRIESYPSGSDSLLLAPYQEPPALPMGSLFVRKAGKQKTDIGSPEILFTGFKKEAFKGQLSERELLEKAAEDCGFKVVKSVTKNLLYLVCGPNAGPMKVEKARAKSVFLMGKLDFENLIETGELPDSECQRLGDMGRTDDFELFSHAVNSWAYLIGLQHLEAVFSFDFREGDVYHHKTEAGRYLQVVYNSEDGQIEVHTGIEGVEGTRRGYSVDAEQMAYWLQLGKAPMNVLDVFRGNSKAGLLAWQLPVSSESES